MSASIGINNLAGRKFPLPKIQRQNSYRGFQVERAAVAGREVKSHNYLSIVMGP
jgi:hypothetical protein